MTAIQATFGTSPNFSRGGGRLRAAPPNRGLRCRVVPGAAASAVTSKSTPTDPVTIVDTETERLLRDRLAVLRPGDPIVGEEEGGAVIGHDGAPTWVLDPIDGTVNFVYGIEAYAVSVGVQVDGRSVAGAVANVPTGEVFSAARGEGARLQRDGVSTPLRCNDVDDLSMALVGTGFGYAPEQRRLQAEVLVRLLPGVRDVRRVGSRRPGSLHGGGGPTGRLLRTRRQRVGLGGGRPGRRGGGCQDAPPARRW